MKHAIKHIHFVGVGGAGMSAIAEILHRLGYRVTGSDAQDSAVMHRLAELGMTVFIGHDAAHIAGAQAVVASAAIPADNPEVAAARAQRTPVVARAVLLAELMRLKTGIAIAGTHGKTTTTALVASVLVEAGLDPTFVIGGQLESAGAAQPSAAGASAASGARLGAGEHIVVEADESDASFLHLSPVISVVTNIDADHMETYGHDLARLRGAFVEFIHRLPFYGRAVLCSDDAGVRAVLPQLQRPITTYGLGEAADLRAVDVQALSGGQMRFVARQSGEADLPVTLNLAGAHNVCNALAAIAVARELELPAAPIARALATFAGVGRRFERHGELPVPAAQGGGTFTLVDDYGHHPAELAAVLAAARGAFPGRRLVLAFQPHRYTRTRDCFADFVAVLGRFDKVLLTEVYAAGDAPIALADGRTLAQAVPGARFVDSLAALPEAIAGIARDGDVVITMGAGSIGAVPGQLRHRLEGAR
ncbi:MAG: UDP-N-acetylmuramate--L-alanine ligase [Rubrivivax sp.]|nr:UDP-N-acetylmuramate--L-alanine ligase [Rubrivivax sp.]